jgi:peptide/nickel transport system substrate-binding protein
MTTDQIFWWNDCFYSNPEYDELFYLQQTQMDPEERRATILEMQRIVYEDAPYIILVYDPELQAYRTDKFEGWVRTPDDGPVIFDPQHQDLRKPAPVPRARPRWTPATAIPRGGACFPGCLLALAAGSWGAFLARRKKQQDA